MAFEKLIWHIIKQRILTMLKGLFDSFSIVTVLSKWLLSYLWTISLFLSLDFSRVKLQREQEITAGIPTDIAVVSSTELLACDYWSKTVSLVDSIRGEIVGVQNKKTFLIKRQFTKYHYKTIISLNQNVCVLSVCKKKEISTNVSYYNFLWFCVPNNVISVHYCFVL